MGTDDNAMALTANLHGYALRIFLVIDQEQYPARVGPAFKRYFPLHKKEDCTPLFMSRSRAKHRLCPDDPATVDTAPAEGPNRCRTARLALALKVVVRR
jgi:hypothetical protein